MIERVYLKTVASDNDIRTISKFLKDFLPWFTDFLHAPVASSLRFKFETLRRDDTKEMQRLGRERMLIL